MAAFFSPLHISCVGLQGWDCIRLWRKPAEFSSCSPLHSSTAYGFLIKLCLRTVRFLFFFFFLHTNTTIPSITSDNQISQKHADSSIMPSGSSTPSWVFTYVPNPKSPTSSSTPTSTSTASTAPTPSLLTPLYKAVSALSTPRLDPEQERLARLQGVKASLEQQIAYRQKAGLPTRDLEKEQMSKIDEALKGLAREKGL